MRRRRSVLASTMVYLKTLSWFSPDHELTIGNSAFAVASNPPSHAYFRMSSTGRAAVAAAVADPLDPALIRFAVTNGLIEYTIGPPGAVGVVTPRCRNSAVARVVALLPVAAIPKYSVLGRASVTVLVCVQFTASVLT
jgi:hypothetical protein